MNKRKGIFDLKQRQIQRIYKKNIRDQKEATEKEIKNTLTFIGCVIFAFILLALYEIIYH